MGVARDNSQGRAPACPLHERDRCVGVCIGYASGTHRGTRRMITLSVKLGEGALARAHIITVARILVPRSSRSSLRPGNIRHSELRVGSGRSPRFPDSYGGNWLYSTAVFLFTTPEMSIESGQILHKWVVP